MTRTLLIPVFVSVAIVASIGPAVSGVAFDFVPRLDFIEEPELVSRDKVQFLSVCAFDAEKAEIETNSCASRIDLEAPTGETDPKE